VFVAAPKTIMKEAATPSLRVLIVDDCEDGANVLALLLEEDGYAVEVAYDGLAAVERATAFQPHVVLLDLLMPRLTGFDAARRLRKQMGQRVVLIAVSAWSHDEVGRAVQADGFDGGMTKPIELEVLKELIATLVASKPSVRTSARRSP
jgi:CheY-like chemotaxis protein